MTEEIARMGFDTTGVYPSERALLVAAEHARRSGLNIRYVAGAGEALPFADGAFGVVFCCDVLEHVRDLPGVVYEISGSSGPGACSVSTPSTGPGPASSPGQGHPGLEAVGLHAPGPPRLEDVHQAP